MAIVRLGIPSSHSLSTSANNRLYNGAFADSRATRLAQLLAPRTREVPEVRFNNPLAPQCCRRLVCANMPTRGQSPLASLNFSKSNLLGRPRFDSRSLSQASTTHDLSASRRLPATSRLAFSRATASGRRADTSVLAVTAWLRAHRTPRH